MSELEKSLEKYFLELPSNFQQAIKEIAWKQTVNKIGLANNLTPEQLSALEAETLMVLYGIEEAFDYTKNLTRELSIEAERAQVISNDITKEVFEIIENKAKELEGKPKPETPIITTQETKKAVIQELAQRVEAAKQGGASIKPNINRTQNTETQGTNKMQVPEVAPEIHPMIKKGGVVHEVPQEEILNPKSQILNKPEIQSEGKPQIAQPAKPLAPVESKAPVPEAQKPTPPPNSRYSGGLDPYREPLE